MRSAVIAAILAVPLAATAGPKLASSPSDSVSFFDRVMQPPKRSPTGVKAFTSVSRVIYLNPCLPNGCTVYPGSDDSRTNRSSIPNTQALLTAWPHGTTAWNQLVQCVKDMYAPFNISVTDVDPGNTNHFEVMVAGNASAIGVDGAGGVAPFEPCDGQLQDNVISFVFAADISNQDFLCWAAAQESSHVFGLDHELNALDPMTYLTPPIKKEGFQNTASNCGEDNPRECWCSGNTQNSYQYLMDTFGPSNLEPGTITITEPKDGQWVKPGFKVKYEVMSQLSVVNGELKIDGSTATATQSAEHEFTAPAAIPGGDHTIMVSAVDAGNRTLTSQVTVHVTATCVTTDGCAADLHCLGGYCLPGADTPGGLGSPCTSNEQCITNTCGSDGTSQLCTGACDMTTGGELVCPDGYACYDTGGGGGVCWPSEEDTGCCSTSTKNAPLHVLFGLTVLGFVVRRRRRRRR